jgi:hypothetical protein
MAKATVQVIDAIQKTVARLEKSTTYQWGHMGSCNCGNLAQVITSLDKAEIHKYAMRRHGDWNEQLIDYCPTSGLPIDHIIDQMLAFGFTREDLAHLERLSDPEVLKILPKDKRYLKHNFKKDVIIYLKAWINLLEDELVKNIFISEFKDKPLIMV